MQYGLLQSHPRPINTNNTLLTDPPYKVQMPAHSSVTHQGSTVPTTSTSIYKIDSPHTPPMRSISPNKPRATQPTRRPYRPNRSSGNHPAPKYKTQLSPYEIRVLTQPLRTCGATLHPGSGHSTATRGATWCPLSVSIGCAAGWADG